MSLPYRTWQYDNILTTLLLFTGDTRLQWSTIINPGPSPAQVESERAETANASARRSAFPSGPSLRRRRFDTLLRVPVCDRFSRQLHPNVLHLRQSLLDRRQGDSPVLPRSLFVKQELHQLKEHVKGFGYSLNIRLGFKAGQKTVRQERQKCPYQRCSAPLSGRRSMERRATRKQWQVNYERQKWWWKIS